MNQEAEKNLTLNLIYPPEKPVKFQLQSANCQTIHLLFRLHSDFIFITNYDLVSKTGSILEPEHDIESDIENDTINVTIQNLPYNETTALEHAQTLARIYFTLSSHRQYSDCRQSYAGWIYRTYSNKYPDIDDLTGFIPKKYTESDIPRPIKTLDLSRNPLTTKERLTGALLKLDVTTCENETFSVFACEKGWYKDPTKIFPTIHHLLLTLSKQYSDIIYFIPEKWLNLMAYEREPFIPLNHTTIFQERKLDKSKRLANRTLLKIFAKNSSKNQDFSLLSLDDLLDDIKDEKTPFVYISKLEKQYAQEALQGIKLIKQGSLYPHGDLNFFVWKDLFIASMDYMGNSQFEYGGYDTANKQLCNEIKAYSKISSSIPSIRVVRTIIIDYFTERWVAQTLIPGLLTNKSKIVFGFNIDDSSKYMHDKQFEDTILENSKSLGIGPSKIKHSDSPIYCSSEMNGIISSEGNLYITDFHRITPRDANFPDPKLHHGYVIREEAIDRYNDYCALESHSEELIALGGDKDFSYRANPKSYPRENEEENDSSNEQETNTSLKILDLEQIQKLEDRRQEIIEKSTKICFDINALTINSNSSQVPQNIQDLSNYLVNSIIPKFVDEYVFSNSFVIDGQSIIKEMHSKGINVRYIGLIHKIISSKNQEKEDPSIKYFLLALESEIISRSFKTLVRHNSTGLQDFINNLNILIGLKDDKLEFRKLFDEIRRISKEKFDLQPNEPQKSQCVLILRCILLSLGITLYDCTFIFDNSNPRELTLDDIASISPLVKFPFSKNNQIESLIKMGMTHYNSGDIESAFKIFNLLLEISKTELLPFDERIPLCYFYLSMIYEREGDYDSAFRNCLKSLIIQEKYTDQCSPDIIMKYSLLAQFSKNMGNLNLAYAFSDRASNLSCILIPNHPWTSVECIDTAHFALALSADLAIKYCQSKIPYYDDSDIGRRQKALFYNIMAHAAMNQQRQSEAISFEKISRSLCPELYK